MRSFVILLFHDLIVRVTPWYCICIVQPYCMPLWHAYDHIHVNVQTVRDFPQTKLDSEISAPFLLNEHGDPQYLFHNFIENHILNN